MSAQPTHLTDFSRYLIALVALFVALMVVITTGGVVRHAQTLETRKLCYASNERIAQTLKGSKEVGTTFVELNTCH